MDFINNYLDSENIELLLSSIADGFVVLDKNMRIIFQNRTVEKAHRNIVGEICHKAVFNNDYLCEDCPVIRTFSDGKIHSAVKKVKLNNKERYLELKTSPFKNKDGEIIGVIETSRDITKKIKTEEKLRKTKNFLDEIINKNSIPSFVLDENQKIIHWNYACEKITGIKAKDAIGTDSQWKAFYKEKRPVMADLIIKSSPEEEIRKHYKTFKKSSLLEESYEGEGFFKSIGEKGKWLYFTAAPIKDSGGKIKGAIETLQDITDIIEAESKIKTSNEQLRSIIENTLEVIILVNEEGKIKEWNKSIEFISSIKRTAVIEKSIFKDNFPQSIKEIIEYLKESFKSRKSELKELKVLDKNENKKTLLSNISFIKEENKVKGLIFVGRDISKERNNLSKLKNASSYIALGVEEKYISRVLSELKEKGFERLCITRKDPEELKEDFKECKDVLNISGKENILKTIINEIKNRINKGKRLAIYLSRIDYLSLYYPFKTLLLFLYELNDLIRENKGILILDVSQECFEKKEIALLKQEFKTFEVQKEKRIVLDKKKIEILKFISNKNMMHSIVKYNSISKEFSLSRLTTRNWLKEFHLENLITIEKIGKTKRIFITEKGKEFLKEL